MAMIDQEPEVDTLGHLEERIQKAVELVTRLRQEKEAALQELAETQAAWEEAQNSNQKLSDELESLRAERKQVRSRLERLLGHIDTLGAE
ncbi:MAG: cell division protein ZapB [Bryobacterales bacterium]|jgi:FtsZ-binding cell division protein ZapB|nr:cell division protein ZapB [Bryobacterales bacterium]